MRLCGVAFQLGSIPVAVVGSAPPRPNATVARARPHLGAASPTSEPHTAQRTRSTKARTPQQLVPDGEAPGSPITCVSSAHHTHRQRLWQCRKSNAHQG
eukprot:3820357-Rhodomonas_salina.1